MAPRPNLVGTLATIVTLDVASHLGNATGDRAIGGVDAHSSATPLATIKAKIEVVACTRGANNNVARNMDRHREATD